MHKIERKYLLKDNIKILIDDLKLTALEISEFYTVVKVCKEIKYRKIDSKYFKITKNGVIGSIKQYTQKIKKNQYLNHKKDSVGKKISKKQYKLSSNGEKYTIDSYQNSLKNLYILEVEFKNITNFNKFVLPEVFSDHVIHEVTDDKRYQNRNLALLGNPKKNPYNIYTIFKDIELARTTNLNKTIFKEMKTSDSIRIILYKLFIELRINQDRIVQTEAKEGIKEFDVALKKSIILLNEYKHIFDKKIIRNVMLHLEVMKKALKTYKDLQYIQKELNNIYPLIDENEMHRIHQSVQHKLSLEKSNMCRFFKTREFSIIFKQYELLLKENNKSFLSIDAQISIGNSIKYKIFKHYKKAIMKCETYERCDDDESYKIINKSLNILKTFFTEFEMIIDKKNHQKAYNITDTISKELSSLRKLHKKKMIVDTYLENLEVKPPNYQKLIKNITKEHKNNSTNIIEKLHKNFSTFKNKKNLFK